MSRNGRQRPPAMARRAFDRSEFTVQHDFSNPYSGINKRKNIIFNYLAALIDWPPTHEKQTRSASHEQSSTGMES